MNYATERVSERCQIKAKRQQRAKQGTTIEPLRGIFRTCLKTFELFQIPHLGVKRHANRNGSDTTYMKMKSRLLPKTQPLQPQNAQHGTTFCPHMAVFSFLIPIFAIRHLHPFRHRTDNQRGAPTNISVNKQL